MMHSGHYNVLRQARQLGDVLIAGVHSSAEIRRNKGPPVMTDEERVAVVSACKWVDEVAFDTPYQPSEETLNRVDADFCVHGDDLPVGAGGGTHAYSQLEAAGRLRLVKRTEGVSTTDLVGRLLLATREHLGLFRLHPLPESEDGGGATAAPAAAPESSEVSEHYARKADCNFLPTSWRIAQFSTARAPGADDEVVYIDGSWDLFHVGHVALLAEAAKRGSYLLVGVHDDKTVNERFGKNYPIMNLHERVLNVLSCGHVDDVIIGAPRVVSDDLLTTFNVSRVLAATGDRTRETVASDDPYKAPRARGLLSKIDVSAFFSTDMLVDRIVANRAKYVGRNKGREVKELAYLKDAKTFVAELESPKTTKRRNFSSCPRADSASDMASESDATAATEL